MFLFISGISRQFGAVSPVANYTQSLEGKSLLSGTAVLKQGVLTITGSNSANDIQISQPDGKKLQVTIDGRKVSFNLGTVNSIVVNAGAGNDAVHTQWGINKPFTLNMGDGNDFGNTGRGADILNGGKGQDRLHGGDGNDRLNGGSENDYLSAGLGSDVVVGGPGADTMLLGNDRVRDVFFANNADTVSNNFRTIDESRDDASSAKLIRFSHPTTGRAVFQGDTVSLHRTSYPGVEGVFYKVAFNGKLQDQTFRANAPITIQVPGGEKGGKFSITSSLKTFLESQQAPGGKTWLQFRAVNYVPPARSLAFASALPSSKLDDLFADNSFSAV